jgi:hypothetical protein
MRRNNVKLLIAVGETPGEERRPEAVAALIAAATEIRVLSPSLVGPLHWLAGDIDKAHRVAEDRLTEMLGRLEGADATVSGVLGDELAGTALADGLRGFDADHVLLVAASSDRFWRRRKVLERLLDEYGVSVTIVLV